ncbi:hypothetical protein [Dethiobacter alkaliphilus]|uniref:Uncharacterized protein n=1 Tax=Dethiobacter alkaliphilus AHT 1 TaxID=555088 RepID=C0GI15_DETAL|nr:hypothetical protein [Dethiobacter alkaliphilus]EEG77089.1 hypothetical protein DealDRAFT_2124 [Dethiobacter alkaliphilus AHT 1]
MFIDFYVAIILFFIYLSIWVFLLRKRNLTRESTIAIMVVLFIVITLWLPGVSLSFDRLIIEDGVFVDDVELIHSETFKSLVTRHVKVYRVNFEYGGYDEGYIIDEISRPLGILYRSSWYTGWFREAPLLQDYNKPFVAYSKRIGDEWFIYIEPKKREIKYIIIGDFEQKKYSLQEAKDGGNEYIIIESNDDYEVLRIEDKWQRTPGIIAFDKQGELVGGKIWDVPWYDD